MKVNIYLLQTNNDISQFLYIPHEQDCESHCGDKGKERSIPVPRKCVRWSRAVYFITVGLTFGVSRVAYLDCVVLEVGRNTTHCVIEEVFQPLPHVFAIVQGRNNL